MLGRCGLFEKMSTLRITSVAHPAASACHGHPADLNDAEIASTKLDGLPVYHEHDTKKAPIGKVLTSYQPTRGEDAGALMCESLITDKAAIERIESGKERGVSLGTELRYDLEGKVISRINQELSVCEQGARPGCVTKWIAKDHGPARRVAGTFRASASSAYGALRAPVASSNPFRRNKNPCVSGVADRGCLCVDDVGAVRRRA